MIHQAECSILIPMAGQGSRLRQYGTPKPFIKIAGRTILEWSVRWIADAVPTARVVVIARRSLSQEHGQSLTKTMNSIARHRWELVVVENHTRGQLDTCMYAQVACPSDDPVIIHNCDTFVSLGESAIPVGLNFVSTFGSRSAQYSYVSVGAESRVEEIVEKRVLPQGNASTGTYGFSSWRLLKNAHAAATKALQGGGGHELFVSLGISQLLRANVFLAHPVAMALPLGTEDELRLAEPVLAANFSEMK